MSEEIVHMLKTQFDAFQMPFDKNIYRAKTSLNADITLLETEDCKAPDALINGFILKPSPLPREKFKGTFCYPKKYFKTSAEALAHLKSDILETPQDPEKHFKEDLVRMLRFCRLANTRPLKLASRVEKAMHKSAEELNIKKINSNTSLFGRIYSELAKIEPEFQKGYLYFLYERNILSQLFSGNFSGIEADAFNLENLTNFLDHFHLKDLFLLHSMGVVVQIDYQGYYSFWIRGQGDFIHKPQNIFDLLSLCQNYSIPFPGSHVKNLLKNEEFDSCLIKGIWGDLTRSLSQLLLNGDTSFNFDLLRECGIFAFLFPKANEAIEKSSVHLEYIKNILTDTQEREKPSISFVYSHFLALEIAHTPDNPEKTIQQISELYDGRYCSIIKPMSSDKIIALISCVTAVKGFSKSLRVPAEEKFTQVKEKSTLSSQMLLSLQTPSGTKPNIPLKTLTIT